MPAESQTGPKRVILVYSRCRSFSSSVVVVDVAGGSGAASRIWFSLLVVHITTSSGVAACNILVWFKDHFADWPRRALSWFPIVADLGSSLFSYLLIKVGGRRCFCLLHRRLEGGGDSRLGLFRVVDTFLITFDSSSTVGAALVRLWLRRTATFWGSSCLAVIVLSVCC
uniref:Uncharacterized protein n=1 Tax=Physcomitrium patens TaxID=3218 RepID=A0A2K1IZX0_PHYPA|nr:hypothetical protein PHYPA_022722 [Physcomitrium patens]